jgi:hypothetical protein
MTVNNREIGGKARLCLYVFLLAGSFSAIANTGLVETTAITYNIKPRSEVVWNYTCQQLSKSNAELSYKKMLAVSVFTQHNATSLRCLRSIAQRYQYFSVYSLRFNSILILASNTQHIPWPKNPGLLLRFIGNAATLKNFNPITNAFWAHQIRWYWQDIGTYLPIDQLYPHLRAQHVSRLHVLKVPMSPSWERLKMQVLLQNPASMLNAAIHILTAKKEVLCEERQYALGVAMLANIRLQQDSAALLLWDRYEKPLLSQHDIPIDFYFLHQYALYQLTPP